MTNKMPVNDYYYDNIKFILIFIVVLGHYCEKYYQSTLLNSMNVFIYSYHMPLFIFLSGYFSKNIQTQRIHDIKYLLVPYVIIQLLYFVILYITNPDYKWSIMLPIGADWYLLGLFVWRLIAPYFRQMQYPLVYSVLIGLIIGMFPEFNQLFNFQRIFAYLPFFVLGYNFSSDYKEKLLIRKANIYPFIFVFIFMLFIVLAYFRPDFIATLKSIQVPLYPYNGLLIDKIFQLLGRSFFYFLSVALSFMFMQMIPNKRTIYSEAGKNSLYVFLFHMFIIYFLVSIFPYKPIITELIAFPLSMIIIIILSNNYIVNILELIIYPWKIKEKFYLRINKLN